MGTAANAKIEYESAQTLVDFGAMTDAGDHLVFTTEGSVWSGSEGHGPQIRPDGVVTGIDILSPGSGNDQVDSIAFTAWLGGDLKEVSPDTVAITRASTLTHAVTSIILTGATLSALKGTEGSAFSAVRGAAGGPPYIPVGSIEIGQVRTDAQTAAVIDSAEIYQTPGTHQERVDYPLYRRPQNLGHGILASSPSRKHAHIEFYTALNPCHTGGVCKGVYIRYYTPAFTAIESNGFVPADTQSTQAYAQRFDRMHGYKTDSLRSASFKAELNDGISDSLVALDGQTLIFRFYPDADRAPYMLTLGTLRFLAAFPRIGQLSMDCVVTVRMPSARFLA